MRLIRQLKFGFINKTFLKPLSLWIDLNRGFYPETMQIRPRPRPSPITGSKPLTFHTLSVKFRNNSPNSDDIHNKSKISPSAVDGKFSIFRDEESPVILDVEEELRLKNSGIAALGCQQTDDEFEGLNLKRGVLGVFDIEELVELLKRDKAHDIFVAQLPPELKYVDYIVVITGKSQRHMIAMAEFVRKVFKRKMHQKDIIPRIEGENAKDWVALDLGNIALHIFSKSARRMYDLDSLWAVGSEFDDLCNKPEDPLITLLQRHSVYLGDLQPNESLG